MFRNRDMGHPVFGTKHCSGVGFEFFFQFGGEVEHLLLFALGFVDVLDGDDSAYDFVVLAADGGGTDGHPFAGAIGVLIENLHAFRSFAMYDGAGQRVFV